MFLVNITGLKMLMNVALPQFSLLSFYSASLLLFSLVLTGSTNATSNVVVIDFSEYDIQAAFIRLTAEISKLLKRADFSTLRRGMIVAHRNVPKGMQFPDDLYQSIRAAQNLDSLLDLLVDSKHWSWVDLRVLEALIESSGIPEAKDLVSKYKKAIFSKKLCDVFRKDVYAAAEKGKGGSPVYL